MPKRNSVIAALIFAVIIPLASISVISHYARKSPEYVHALTFASAAPEVVADLGDAIDDGPLPSIKWPMSTDKPTVNVNMTLKSPNGKGTVSLTEVRQPSGWQVTSACWTFNDRTKQLASERSPVSDVGGQ